MIGRVSDYTDFAHTGPGTLAGRYLRSFWQPVYLARELQPGRAVPIRVMGEDFTLYRGEGGAPHVMAFRCAHRATQLSTGWEDVKGRPDIVGIQDYVSQVGQGVIADRESERLGRSDVGIIILRKLWSAELRALAEGKALRHWRRPEGVYPAPGAI